MTKKEFCVSYTRRSGSETVYAETEEEAVEYVENNVFEAEDVEFVDEFSEVEDEDIPDRLSDGSKPTVVEDDD